MTTFSSAGNNCIMVGCDLHYESMVLKIAIDRDKPQTLSYANTFAGRKRLIADLTKRSLRAGRAKVHLVYEACGLGFTLCDELREAGFQCDVIAPTKVERSPKHKRTKSDEKDAERLLAVLRGHLLAGNDLPKVWIPCRQTRDDREVLRARLDAGDKLTKVKTQIQTLLKRKGIEKPKTAGSPWTVKYRQWLQQLTQCKGQLQGMAIALGSLLRQTKTLEDEVDQLDVQIASMSEEPRYKQPVDAMVAEKGVGRLTAMVFLTELGDLKRFSNHKQVSSYLGLVPSSNESGEKQDRKGHITREGPSRVRKVLCQAAWNWVRLDQRAKQHYTAMRERGKDKKKALVAMMRILGVRLWHLGLKGIQSQNLAA